MWRVRLAWWELDVSALDNGMGESQTSDRPNGHRSHGGREIPRRYAMVLDAVAQAACALRLAAIGKRTGLSQPATHWLVRALGQAGFLAQEARCKFNKRGPRLLRRLFARTSNRVVSASVRVPDLRADPDNAMTDPGEAAGIASRRQGSETRSPRQPLRKTRPIQIVARIRPSSLKQDQLA